MGSDRLAGESGDDEGPTRLVTVGSMAIGRSCVSVADFAVFAEATSYRTTAETAGTGWVGSSEGGWIVGANWRAPDGHNAAADAGAPAVQLSWYDCQEFCRWSGTLLATEAQWARAGLFDATVWQWCADFYHPTFHRDEQRVNPTGPIAGTERVLRGGSPVATQRAHHMPDFASDSTGFRVVAARR